MYIGSQLRESVPIVRFREPFKRVGSFANVTSLELEKRWRPGEGEIVDIHELINKLSHSKLFFGIECLPYINITLTSARFCAQLCHTCTLELFVYFRGRGFPRFF